MAKYYFYIFLSIVLLAALIVGLVVRYLYKKGLEKRSETALRLGMNYDERGNLVGNYR